MTQHWRATGNGLFRLGNLGRALHGSHISTEAQGLSVGHAEGCVCGGWSVGGQALEWGNVGALTLRDQFIESSVSKGRVWNEVRQERGRPWAWR